MVIFCPHCERPTAKRTDLGYFANDGTTGRVAGTSCAACGYIAEDPDAEYIAEGTIDLEGMTAMEWFIKRLRELGCNPRPRP